MFGVVALSGCLVWYGTMLGDEKEKFKKQKAVWDDDYGKLWDLKDKFRDERDQLMKENTTLKTLIDYKNDAIAALENDNKILNELLDEKTVLKIGYSSVPTQEFKAESVESRPDYIQIDGSCFATNDEIKTMMVDKCAKKICEDMMRAEAFDIREELENDLMNCCKNRRITVKARAVVFSK